MLPDYPKHELESRHHDADAKAFWDGVRRQLWIEEEEIYRQVCEGTASNVTDAKKSRLSFKRKATRRK
jgi:hypothetical protein